MRYRRLTVFVTRSKTREEASSFGVDCREGAYRRDANWSYLTTKGDSQRKSPFTLIRCSDEPTDYSVSLSL